MGELTGITKQLNLKKEILTTFFERENRISSWVNGFDTPSKKYSSSGKHFSNLTFGHLGFTGTSFWFDLKKRCCVVLLTNRVLCSDKLSKMKKFRPLVHDLFMENVV